MKLRPSASFLATVVLSSSLIACGGGGDDGDDVVVIEGDPHPYVIDSITTDVDGEDIDNDGSADNQLATVIATLESDAVGFEVQAALDDAVNTGSVILLADMTTTNFTDATGAGFTVYIGDNPTPAPCADENDTACRLHLDGNGSFDVAADSPTDGTVAGSFSGAGFYGQGGTINLQIALNAEAPPISVRLIAARARLTEITATDIAAGVIAGAIPEEDINNEILPAVVTLVADIVAEDCTGKGEDCGCVADSAGAGALGFLDANGDCEVPLAELQANAVISGLLGPETDTDGDGEDDALSAAVGITAVSATYTKP